MGLIDLYSKFLLRNPGRILVGGVILVVTLFTITILVRPLPSFKDPLVGFEVRNTFISNRINAWKLLNDETSASANNLSLGSNSALYEAGHRSTQSINHKDLMPESNEFSNKIPPLVEMSIQDLNKSSPYAHRPLEEDEDEDEYFRSINSTINVIPSLMHFSLNASRAFCGKLYEGYAQVVVVPTQKYSNSGLFNLNSMIAICQLDARLRLEQSQEDSAIFQRDCERFQFSSEGGSRLSSACCNSWSIPNYVACLSNKTTCMDIEASDLVYVENLLNLCAPHYFRAPYEECFEPSNQQMDGELNLDHHESSSTNILSSTSRVLKEWPRSHCGSIPEKCLSCEGWTYSVLHYLTNEGFVQGKQRDEVKVHGTPTSNIQKDGRSTRGNTTKKNQPYLGKLSHTNIFLPMAKSSSLLRYYHTLSKYNLKTAHAYVKAMDLGLKNSLFDHLISSDTSLFVISLATILIVVSIYTWSLVLSLVILMIICLSLCLSYTVYEMIFNIPIFPFMNLLAVVISFGICSDNAMLFCKYWTAQEDIISIDATEPSGADKSFIIEQSSLNRMLKKAMVSTSVATIATACSFIISAISQVIAVRCFCIFATLTVITNYLLIVILLPPALILDSRYSSRAREYLVTVGPKVESMMHKSRNFRRKFLDYDKKIHAKWFYEIVTNYRYYLIISFITLLSCSSVLVFYRPTLQPADDDEIQLLSRKHAFEQYDKGLRRQFIFERFKLGETVPHNPIAHLYEPLETLPVRIVFGIKAQDNGNYLDSQDRGTIEFDPSFDLADPKAQVWMLEFCRKLKQQRFVHQSPGLDLSNCFIETFKSWMDNRSCRDPVQPTIDRSPCCQSEEFPYSRQTFYTCISTALDLIRKTPQLNRNLNSGIRFFKNSSRVASMIVEYQSNKIYSESFTRMERFFNDIDEWVSWQINNTAPASLKSGWFISNNLELLALQTELEQSTSSSISIELIFAMIALLLGTRDFWLTLAGTITIGSIIIVTVSVLIILKWTLGVTESILISLTIGLSIDFALHYSVAFSETKSSISSNVIIMKILEDVGSPIALATVTTFLAGFVIAWSDILAYQELGVFLMLIALISWASATFFLLPMLTTMRTLMDQSNVLIKSLARRSVNLITGRL